MREKLSHWAVELDEALGEGRRESQLGAPPLPDLRGGGASAVRGQAWKQ